MIAPHIYLIALIGGVLAGITNTLAGSGSLITLPVLVMLGLPVHQANGTNRVGIIIQNIVALHTLKRRNGLNLYGSQKAAIPIVLGALVGAFIAIDVSEEVLNIAIGCVMVGMFFVLLIKPSRWLESRQTEPTFHLYHYLVFFIVGIYGGFIQAGVGVLLLISLVLGVGYDLIRANGIKLLLALIFTLPVILVFIWKGDVNWELGLLMALGQSIGAYVAARFMTQSKTAPIWIRRMLLLITLIGAFRFFYPTFQSLF